MLQLTAQGKAKLGGTAVGSNATYVALGLGKMSTMVGKVVAEPAVHFSDDATAGPQDKYCRYVAIYKTTDELGNALDRARLIGVVGLHSDTISGIGDHLQEYYNIVKASQ